MNEKKTLLEVRDVSLRFEQAGHGAQKVLDHINLTIASGEVVGLLGRSGAGKSTLLRIIAGLIPPTSGEVEFQGTTREDGSLGIAMVFQTFALFPWLTVKQNVEVGLEDQQVAAGEMNQRALDAIELTGLRGFESAYPRELSGGMRQRVGFARAFVVRPDLLLLDEPFSALDVLTARTLQSDLVDMWIEGKLPIRAVLLVTHNIEEAVLLCDRVLVLGSNPGRIAAEVPVTCARPRDRLDDEFQAIVDHLYALLTAPATSSAGEDTTPAYAHTLPNATAPQMAGLLKALEGAPYGGHANLSDLSKTLHMPLDDLMPVANAVHLLGFAQLDANALQLTAAGRAFVDSGPEAQRSIFAEHLVHYVPLAARIRRAIHERQANHASMTEFLELLRPYMTDANAMNLLQILVGWGRYAGLYSYDARTGQFGSSLEDAQLERVPAT